MRQRLGIAAAMLGDPPVLMLDEPFNGMDPEGTREMRGFLRALAAEGRAVLISSHLMSELEDTASHLVIVGRGRVIADTSTRDLLAAASGDQVTVRTSAAAGAAAVLQAAGAVLSTGEPGTLTASGLAAEQVVRLLAGKGVPFSEVAAHRASLEQAYLDLTRDAVEYRAAPAGAAPAGAASARAASAGDSSGGAAPPGALVRRGLVWRGLVPGGHRCDPVSAVITRPRPGPETGRPRFGRVLHAEWTKFRTVRGWLIGMFIGMLLIMVIPLLDHSSCGGQVSAGSPVVAGLGCSGPAGPGGEGVIDSFYFVHQPLARHGSHHRPDDLADQPGWPDAVGQGRGHHQGQPAAWLGLRGHDGHRRTRGPHAIRLHRRYRRPPAR